jgi:hypothetical protein
MLDASIFGGVGSSPSKVAQTSCSSKSAAFSQDEPQSFSKLKLYAYRLYPIINRH